MKTRSFVLISFFVALLIFLVWTIFLIFWVPRPTADLAQQWVFKANIGQAFGALSAGFSSLAFGAVLYTIYLQQNQLRIQREEAEQSRDQLRKTVEAQERSVTALQKQVELLAVSARLNGLSALIESELKVKELQLSEYNSRGPSGGIRLNYENVNELHDKLTEEFDSLSGKPRR